MIKDIKCFFKTEVEPYDINWYQRILIVLIGKLLYLTNTRPDISYVVQFFSRFTYSPIVHHYKAIQSIIKIIKYIKRAPAQGIFFSKHSTSQIKLLLILIRQHAKIQDAQQLDIACS